MPATARPAVREALDRSPPILPQQLAVLVIDDDEEDYLIARRHLRRTLSADARIDWAGSYREGLARIGAGEHEVYLVDYSLGARSGAELIDEAVDAGHDGPFIVLTGRGSREIDLASMRAGAADYLSKGSLTPEILERSLRYAVEQHKTLRDRKVLLEQLEGLLYEAEWRARRNGCFNELRQTVERDLPVSQLLEVACRILPKAFEHPDRVRVTIEYLERTYAAAQGVDFERVHSTDIVIDGRREGRAHLHWLRGRDATRREAADADAGGDRTTRISWETVATAVQGGHAAGHNGSARNGSARPQAESPAEETPSLTAAADMRLGDEERTLFDTFVATLGESIARKRAEEQLTLIYSVIGQLADGLAITDAGSERGTVDGPKILYVNEAFVRLGGVAAGTLVGKPVATLDALFGDANLTERVRAALRRQRSCETDLTRRGHRGGGREEQTTLRLHLEPVSDRHGLVSHCVLTFRDVTETLRQRRLMAVKDDQLRHSQRLDSIGRLAGSVAHSFRNVLTGIGGFNDLALHRATDPSVVADLEQIRNLTDRATELTQHLLTFSRKAPSRPQRLNANAGAESNVRMLRSLVPAAVRIEIDVDPRLPDLFVDPQHIDQIMMNLLFNSRDAVAGCGAVRVETSAITLRTAPGDDRRGLRPGNHVVLTVSDDGCGMSEEQCRRVFEPFFTTKEEGEGTGLGMSTVYGIVKTHCGHIWIHSQPDRGTCVKVYLPAESRPAAPDRIAPVAPDRTTRLPVSAGHACGGERIVVAEADPFVRTVAQRTLRDCGYDVLAAGAPTEVRQLWLEYGDSVSLLVSGSGMPLHGPQSPAQAARRLRPDLNLLYLVDAADTDTAADPDLPGDADRSERSILRVDGPFPGNHLLRMVRTLLG